MKKQFTVTNEMIEAGKNVFMAMAYTETVRPIVEDIKQKVIDKFCYTITAENRLKHGQDILKDSKHVYLISERDRRHFFTEVHERYISNGFQIEFGYCPLLIAESLQRDAERLLIEVMEPVAGVTYDMIISAPNMRKNYKILIDLNLKLLAPYCNNINKENGTT